MFDESPWSSLNEMQTKPTGCTETKLCICLKAGTVLLFTLFIKPTEEVAASDVFCRPTELIQGNDDLPRVQRLLA